MQVTDAMSNEDPYSQTMRIHIADDDETITVEHVSSRDELMLDSLSAHDEDAERIVL